MAETTVTLITDDIDGSPDAVPVYFEVNGNRYRVDLSQKNLDKFQKAMAPYVEYGTKQRKDAMPAKPASKSGGINHQGVDTMAVRQWALTQGIDLGVRGRIPQDIVDKYKAETGQR